MSGFYGIVRFDGAPIDPLWLHSMQSAMAYYGPHGGAAVTQGPVAMGHLRLDLNPEDLSDRQPVALPSGLVVSAARLDNRDALLQLLDLPAADAPQLADGQLLALAFDRWGEDACSRLEGDWAFAAWDRHRRRLVLARDILGRAALYYHQGPGYIAFASSLKALLALPGTPRQPDLLRLAQVLVAWHHDAELTAYRHLRTVVGAHVMSFAAGGLCSDRRFWSPIGRRPLRLRRREEYAEAFLEHYGRAVRGCLRTRHPVAAELSSGRDSGSVVALAAPLLAAQGRELTAFTAVPCFPPDGADPSRIGNEWDLAHATALMAGPNVHHLAIDARAYGVLAGVRHFLQIHDGIAHPAANYFWSQAIMEACSQRGLRALLLGEIGNATVSFRGNGSVLLALLQGRPASALQLLLHADPNPWIFLKRQILNPLVTPLRRLRARLGSPSRSLWQSYSALHPHMARRLCLDLRMRDAGYDPALIFSTADDLRHVLHQPEFGASASVLSEANAWHGVTRLDPTANHALLEFLLRVPDEQFYRRGDTAMFFKQAFRHRMPDPVVFARKRGLQAADLGHRIRRERSSFDDCLQSLASLPEACELLDLSLMRRTLDAVCAHVNPETTQDAASILVRGLGVGLFLLHLDRPGAP